MTGSASPQSPHRQTDASMPLIAPFTTVPRFVELLDNRGVNLSVTNGNRIFYRAPHGAIGPTEKEYIQNRRDLLCAYLLAREAGPRPPLIPTKDEVHPSLQQELYWLAIKKTGYVMSENLKIIKVVTGIDSDRILRAIRNLVSKHDALRYSFREVDGEIKISLNAIESFHIDIASCENIDLAEKAANEFVSKRIKIQDDWLVSAKIIVAPHDTVLLAFCFHHWIFDAGSRKIFERELIANLATEGLTKSPPLKHGALQFNDFVSWDRRWINSDAGKLIFRYWTEWVDSVPLLRSPSGRPLVWVSGKSGFQHFVLNSQVTAAVERTSQSLGTSISTFFLAIFALTMWRWSGQHHFAITILKDVRSTVELGSTIGLLYSECPIEAVIDTHADVRQFVDWIQNETLAGQRWALTDPCVPTMTDYFEFFHRIGASFNFNHPRPPGRHLPDSSIGEAVWPTAAPGPDMKARPHPHPPLYFRCSYGNDKEIRGEFDFRCDAITAKEQEEFANLFLRFLKLTTLNADLKVIDLS